MSTIMNMKWCYTINELCYIDDVLEDKCFGGKSFLDIENDVEVTMIYGTFFLILDLQSKCSR